jgi:radical SAM protein with 4Fe4S-binding SPASM domain
MRGDETMNGSNWELKRRYCYNNVEIIKGIKNAVIYKLDTKKRYLVEDEVADLLQKFVAKDFELAELQKSLIALLQNNNLGDVADENQELTSNFISFLVKEEIIEKSSQGIHHDYASVVKQDKINNRKIEILGLEILDKCNFVCPHCAPDSSKDKANFLEYKLLEELLIWAEENVCKEVFITGGEPFLHDDISEILNLLSKIKIRTVITTNASLLSEEHIETLVNSNINLRVSLYGSETYYQKYGGSPKLKEKIEAISVLLNSKMNRRFSCVIPLMKSNMDSLQYRVDFCESHKILYQINLISPFGRAFCNWDKEKIDENTRSRIQEQQRRYLRDAYPKYISQPDNKSHTISVYPCNLNQINVMSNRVITPCLSIKNPGIAELTKNRRASYLKDIFFSKEYIDYHNTFYINNRVVCNRCEYKYDCGGGCPARALQVLGQINAPDPQCKHHDAVKLYCNSLRHIDKQDMSGGQNI